MGQCYLMTLDFRGDFNAKAIVKKTIEFMRKRATAPDETGRKVRFKDFPTEDMTLLQAIKKLIGDQDCGQLYREINGECVAIPNGYLAGFDGSYGFGDVVEDWFAHIAPVAGEGTEFYLEPDHGHTTAVVKDGKAEFVYCYD